MGKELAIKGHPTRGKEIIELLEKLGGHVDDLLDNGTDEKYAYFIVKDENNVIDAFPIDKKDEFDFDAQIFTLEEFLEKYPFKVGDKVVYTKFGDNCDDYPVTIESMKWTGTTIEYTFNDCVTCLAKDLKMWNSNDNHTNVSKMKNVLTELLEHIKTTSKEDLEREFEEIKEWSNVGPTVEEFMTFCECVNKKPAYPKTFRECRAILNYMEGNMSGYKASLFASLQDLLICRDAYWKIAGDEMSLGKPWEPDWTSGKPVYCISVSVNAIGTGKWYTDNKILAFPTKEMRDAFYENFKDLIEECKELL
jgi:hypothetical protein